MREQDHDDEALALSQEAERAAADDDVDAQVQWRSVRAPILARRGQLDEAEALARRALTLALQADAPLLQAEACADLAEVLLLAGRRDEAHAQFSAAAELWSAKGDRVSAARARGRLTAA